MAQVVFFLWTIRALSTTLGRLSRKGRLAERLLFVRWRRDMGVLILVLVAAAVYEMRWVRLRADCWREGWMYSDLVPKLVSLLAVCTVMRLVWPHQSIVVVDERDKDNDRSALQNIAAE